MIEAGSDINIEDRLCMTPLYMAKNEETANLLMLKGAHCNLLSEAELRALEVSGNKEIFNFIKDIKGKVGVGIEYNSGDESIKIGPHPLEAESTFLKNRQCYNSGDESSGHESDVSQYTKFEFYIGEDSPAASSLRRKLDMELERSQATTMRDIALKVENPPKTSPQAAVLDKNESNRRRFQVGDVFMA